MRDLTEFSQHEQECILRLTTGRVDLPEFLRIFGRNIADDRDFVQKTLRRITESRDAESLPFLFYLWGFLDEPPEKEHLQLLRRLLSESWHSQHEWVVDTLRRAKDVESIPALTRAAQAEYPDLDELDETSLRNRCVYAIEAIGGGDANAALKDLSSGQSETAELAASLLSCTS
ncbi:MAG: hypothetical protein RIK87_26780 [Fuerstiella sp.]